MQITHHKLIKKYVQPSFALGFVLCLIFFISCKRASKPISKNELNFNPTFSLTDKNPMGCYVADKILRKKFEGFDIETNKKSFEEYYKDYTKYDFNRSGRVYAIITQYFLPSEKDLDKIENFVNNGNTFFLAANYFDEKFLDKYHLAFENPQFLDFTIANGGEMSDTKLKMSDSTQFLTNPYGFYFYTFQSSIQRNSDYEFKTISQNTDGSPSAVAYKYGNGRFIVVANATALTNYFLLTGDNYRYFQNLLAYTPLQQNALENDEHHKISTTGLTIDEHYQKMTSKDGGGESGMFKQLFKHPALSWAFWLLLLLALLWIINGLIRRQRIIEVVKPNTNSSVEFAETVARLYLLKKDNKNIATKMITFFLEKVRNNYYLNTTELNENFSQKLAIKSGQGIDATKQLLQVIDGIEKSESVGDHSLLELNTLMQKFI